MNTINGFFADRPGERVTLYWDGIEVGEVRPTVAAMALRMEETLQTHDDRPGWEGDDIAGLYRHLKEEIDEFKRAYYHLSPDNTCAEGTDVQNMMKMVIQQLHGLDAYLAQLRGENAA